MGWQACFIALHSALRSLQSHTTSSGTRLTAVMFPHHILLCALHAPHLMLLLSCRAAERWVCPSCASRGVQLHRTQRHHHPTARAGVVPGTAVALGLMWYC
jgi:hypothetical protein